MVCQENWVFRTLRRHPSLILIHSPQGVNLTLPYRIFSPRKDSGSSAPKDRALLDLSIRGKSQHKSASTLHACHPAQENIREKFGLCRSHGSSYRIGDFKQQVVTSRDTISPMTLQEARLDMLKRNMPTMLTIWLVRKQNGRGRWQCPLALDGS